MVRILFSALLTLGLAVSAYSKDHNVGGGDFPKEVKVGDVIKFDRPSQGGRLMTVVKVNGKEVKGELVNDKVDGKTVIGAGKNVYEVKADKAGTIEIEITVTPAGEKDKAATKKHKVEVKE